MTDEQAAKIIETLGRLDERTIHMQDMLEGNGQPGLVQKVENLEAHNNRVIGGVTVVGVLGAGLWGLLEYLFHFKTGGAH